MNFRKTWYQTWGRNISGLELGEVYKFHDLVAVVQKNFYLGIDIQDKYLYKWQVQLFQILHKVHNNVINALFSCSFKFSFREGDAFLLFMNIAISIKLTGKTLNAS